jgi:hypothetical protein
MNSKKIPARKSRIILVMAGNFKFYDAGETVAFDMPDDDHFPFVKKALIPVGDGCCAERPTFQTDKFLIVFDKNDVLKDIIAINGDYYVLVEGMVAGNGDDQRISEWYSGIYQEWGNPKNMSNVLGAHYLLVFGGIGSLEAIPCATCKSIVKISDNWCPHCGESIQVMREDIERAIKEHVAEQPVMPVLAGER